MGERHLAEGDEVVAKYPDYRGWRSNPWFAAHIVSIDAEKKVCAVRWEAGGKTSEGVQAEDEILYAPGRDVGWGSGNGWYLAHGNDSAPANAQPVLTDSGKWRLLPPPLSEEYARIQRAFNAFDVDGSGTISASEMKAILSRCKDECVVVGAGCARCNGSYVHAGAYKSNALYQCSSTGLQIWFNEGEWRLGSTRDYYYVSASEWVDDPVWRVATGELANADTAEAAPTVTLVASRGLSASDVDAVISEFDENGDGELDTHEFAKACCGLDTRFSTRMLDICVDCGRKVKVEAMIEARNAEMKQLRETCYAHAYKAPDAWLRTVLVDAVCAVPADVWEEGGPPADWQESIVKLLEQCRLFHSSGRAFGAASTMRWRLRGPAPMPLTAAQYREKSNWFFYFRDHIRALDEEAGIEVVAESWQFSDVVEEDAPTYTVQCVFADWGCDLIPISQPYVNLIGNLRIPQEESKLRGRGGCSCACRHQAIITEEVWKYPDLTGAGIVVYHEALGHGLGIPHASQNFTYCVMAQGMYSGKSVSTAPRLERRTRGCPSNPCCFRWPCVCLTERARCSSRGVVSAR